MRNLFATFYLFAKLFVYIWLIAGIIKMLLGWGTNFSAFALIAFLVFPVLLLTGKIKCWWIVIPIFLISTLIFPVTKEWEGWGYRKVASNECQRIVSDQNSLFCEKQEHGTSQFLPVRCDSWSGCKTPDGFYYQYTKRCRLMFLCQVEKEIASPPCDPYTEDSCPEEDPERNT